MRARSPRANRPVPILGPIQSRRSLGGPRQEVRSAVARRLPGGPEGVIMGPGIVQSPTESSCFRRWALR
jgi:hypothetical protein